MQYSLKPMHCRPWLLNGLSLKLIESHYENNYGAALRRLNAIIEQLESLDSESAPGHIINGLKRHVGCGTARKLQEAGFDAKYMNSGHLGWKASGGPVRLKT